MSFLKSIAAAFKGADARPPLARAFTSPWAFSDSRAPFEYASAVRHAYLDNPVAQRAVRLVAEGIGGAPLAPTVPKLAALVQATSAGQSLLETLASQLLLHGNAYVQVMKDGAGFPVELFALRPERIAGQAQKEAFVNEAHALLDALLHGVVEARADAPPADPDDGLCWLVGDTPTGAWADRAGKIACRQQGMWLFVEPRDGLRMFDRSNGQELFHNAGWIAPEAPAAPAGGATIDGEARAAIALLIQALREVGIFSAA